MLVLLLFVRYVTENTRPSSNWILNQFSSNLTKSIRGPNFHAKCTKRAVNVIEPV